MRLAFITVGDTSRLTGGYLYNARLLAGLRERGVKVEEVVASGATEEEQEAASERFGSSFDPAEFDVIVVDALACAICAPHLDRWRKVCLLAAMIHELPSVASPDSESHSRDWKLEEPLLRADVLVAVSHHGKSVLGERGAPEERIHVAPPGFERLVPEAGGRDLRESHGPRALCVAQWIERKGVLELVHAWKSRRRKDAHLRLVGETDADPEYADRVRDAIGADTSITVTGPLEHAALQQAYASADIFILASRYEGYGMVYAEALGSGLPIIARDVGPVPEVVGEEAGLLVPPGDEEALRGALDRLLSERDLRARMSRAARKRAEALPRWEDTVSGFHEALRRVHLGRREV